MVYDSSEDKGFMMIKRVNAIASNTPVFIIGFLFLSWFALSSQPAKISGSLFPVVTTLEIKSVQAYEYNGMPATKIAGTIKKLRDCDFKAMNWYIGGANNGTVASTFLDAPQGRGKGVQYFTGILVGIHPSLLEHTFAEVRHSCLGMMTTTDFYKGSLSGL
jgi:hypothetical protein